MAPLPVPIAYCGLVNPMKVLPAMSEAGIILTDEALRGLKSLRYHGMIDRWRTATLGKCTDDTIHGNFAKTTGTGRTCYFSANGYCRAI